MGVSIKKIMVLDCQTTGMHPKTSYLAQLGWTLFDEVTDKVPIIQKRTFILPENAYISKEVKQFQHLQSMEFQHAQSPLEIMNEFFAVTQSLDSETLVIIHYAQFEINFLKHYFSLFLNIDNLPFVPLCTQKLCKILLPNLPSYTLKGLAGALNLTITLQQEVSSHIQATLSIWKILNRELLKLGISSTSNLEYWLATAKKTVNDKYFYNVKSFERLKLGNTPGVYKMLGRHQEVLYIGKATSLKQRVNSYFRGVKNRDKFKLEMLAQTWDIETINCSSTLEAELLESDLIKQYKPPYNILLQEKNRRLIFYTRDFQESAVELSLFFCEGPYRVINALQILIDAHIAYTLNQTFSFFLTDFSANEQCLGWELFCELNELSLPMINDASPRILIAIGYSLLRRFERLHGKYQFEKWWLEEKKFRSDDGELTVDKLAGKIYRMFIRAAEAKRKNQTMLKIYNSSVDIVETQQTLSFKDEFNTIDIATYDKLSILFSAKKKNLIVLN